MSGTGWLPCNVHDEKLAERQSQGGIDFQPAEKIAHRQQKFKHKKWIALHFLAEI